MADTCVSCQNTLPIRAQDSDLMLPRSPQGPSVRKRTAESINERGGVKLPAAHLKITPARSRLGTGCLAGKIQSQLAAIFIVQDGVGNARLGRDEKGGQARAVGGILARGRRRRVFLRPSGSQLLAMACGPISSPRLMKSSRRDQLSKCRYGGSARRGSKNVRRAPTVARRRPIRWWR